MPQSLSVMWVAFTLARITAFGLGFSLVVWTLQSAIRAFVLPRSARVALQRFVFRRTFSIFRVRLRRADSYGERDRIAALFAPVALLTMPIACLFLILLGYTGMFWAITMPTWKEALILSGSSLFTLGFALETSVPQIILIYTEATIGLGLVALLISYLPTMYNAFSERERAVAMLEVRAGDPPSAVEMIKRFNRLGKIDSLSDFFIEWEVWFAAIEESHTSLSALVFFRSPQPERSWVTAAGAVLDGAALYVSTVVDDEANYRASLCIRAGYIALRRIADFFQMSYRANPSPDDPISITKEEFLVAYHELFEAGVPIVADVESAWKHYAGWRVNYDEVLIQLADLTMAPYAPWISDRSLVTRPDAKEPRKRFWNRMRGRQ